MAVEVVVVSAVLVWLGDRVLDFAFVVQDLVSASRLVRLPVHLILLVIIVICSQDHAMVPLVPIPRLVVVLGL